MARKRKIDLEDTQSPDEQLEAVTEPAIDPQPQPDATPQLQEVQPTPSVKPKPYAIHVKIH